MLKNNFTHKDYTINGEIYQLKLPLNIEMYIPNNDSVRLLGQIVEEMDLSEIYQSYSRIRKNQASPKKLFKIVIYANMNKIYSSRDIESACKRDINFMYLLEGSPAPDHATIARFRTLHMAPYIKNLLSQLDGILDEIGEISLENLFIDGTKIESSANRYSFVWKKAVTKNQKKLLEKIPVFLKTLEEEMGWKLHTGHNLHVGTLKSVWRKLNRVKQREKIKFVHGRGKHKPKLQKAMEEISSYIKRLRKYSENLHIAGARNSYAKTDKDATFMRLKEDHMLNGQLKPAYNIQFGVDSEYIVWLTAGPQATDTTTLIPFLEDMAANFHKKYKNIVADAGYESEENYLYLKENGLVSYIKPSIYEKSKTRKYKGDIGLRENMTYNNEEDCYICKNGKKMLKVGIRSTKSKTGYKLEKTIYKCEDCNNCPYKNNCVKGNNSKVPLEERTKRFEVSKAFIKERQENTERITSVIGRQLRMNRSIQAEGAFAVVKADMQFRRFLSKGMQNISAEVFLLAFAHNINKLHAKIQTDRMKQYLHPLNEAKKTA